MIDIQDDIFMPFIEYTLKLIDLDILDHLKPYKFIYTLYTHIYIALLIK